MIVCDVNSFGILPIIGDLENGRIGRETEIPSDFRINPQVLVLPVTWLASAGDAGKGFAVVR